MIERMVEVEDVKIAGPVDDMKEIGVHAVAYRGDRVRKGEQVFGAEGTKWRRKAVKTPTPTTGDLAWASNGRRRERLRQADPQVETRTDRMCFITVQLACTYVTRQSKFQKANRDHK